ncbi:hypothetical protein Dace_0927 [Desulfuromonas acetoxidans DSM 684]|uniref:Uncharacterized protein n=1 Tax=Desulfuromonas acetoxidans (strain DSM 684 / 11070) TaxID=281689 RepID=Q1JX74_DESA6|nr:hypothetical protein Dace_0927 [Desulfuromonas acetoxidans DSM 684]
MPFAGESGHFGLRTLIDLQLTGPFNRFFQNLDRQLGLIVGPIQYRQTAGGVICCVDIHDTPPDSNAVLPLLEKEYPRKSPLSKGEGDKTGKPLQLLNKKNSKN